MFFPLVKLTVVYRGKHFMIVPILTVLVNCGAWWIQRCIFVCCAQHPCRTFVCQEKYDCSCLKDPISSLIVCTNSASATLKTWSSQIHIMHKAKVHYSGLGKPQSLFWEHTAIKSAPIKSARRVCPGCSLACGGVVQESTGFSSNYLNTCCINQNPLKYGGLFSLKTKDFIFTKDFMQLKSGQNRS